MTDTKKMKTAIISFPMKLKKSILLFLLLATNPLLFSTSPQVSCLIVIIAASLTAIFITIKPNASFPRIITFAIIIYIILFLIYFVLMIMGLKAQMTTITNINKYDKIIKKAKNSGYEPDIFHHFPDSIPPDAENVYFHYNPTFLQGDGRLRLYFKTSPERIEKYYEQFSKISTKTYPADETMYFYLSNKESMELDLTEDYTSMRFDEIPEYWQEHDDEHGVYISREKKEIVFWAKGLFYTF